MGCAVSKQGEDDDDVVSLCRERKRLLKLAVERRYAFADAQCKYNQSLLAVAAAIRLFVARHSSPSSPFLITFPSNSEPTETVITNPRFLQQRPTEPTHEAIGCQSSNSTVSLASPKAERELREQKQNTQEDNEQEDDVGDAESQEDEGESGDEEVVCEHFYDEAAPLMPSPQKEFGWDFFYPFDGVKTEEVSGFSQSAEEDLRAVREKKGIPELEEDGERVARERKFVSLNNGDVGHEENEVTDARAGDDAKVSKEEKKGLRVIDTPTNGRELLEALKDVEDHFVRAYDSGLDVSRMLEANRIQLQSGFEEIKESSSKLIRSITWNRSALSRSSSCKSLLKSSSNNSRMTEFKNDLFDDYGGMGSGSHSSTLGRLYAWEKKLYKEMKAGDESRKIYVRKCSVWRSQSATEDSLCPVDKTTAEVKDLQTRIMIAIRSAESISERIQKLRDEELHPQLVELLHGLMRNWKMTSESHETQDRIMFEVTSFNCPAYGKFCNDSHRLATLQLGAELHNWRACFTLYISTQKAYIEALYGWLSKFIAPEVELYSRGRTTVLPCRTSGPPLLVICHDWLACLEKLPDKAVTSAMKIFGRDIRVLWVQQGEEQQQRRKVHGLANELDRRVMAFQRAESRILESKHSGQESDVNVRNRIEYLAERKNLLDMSKNRLDAEKAKHLTSMQETQQITVIGFQKGFSSIFKSVSEFSKACVEMYADLVTYSENAKAEDEKGSNTSYIKDKGSQVSS